MKRWIWLWAVVLLSCVSLRGTRSSTQASPALVRPEDAERAVRSLSSFLSPRGLVLVTRVEHENGDGDGPVGHGLADGRVCSPRDLQVLARHLSGYVEERARLEEPVEWSCAGDQCEARGMMEYDPYRVLKFARNASGELEVVAYYELDLLLTSPEVEARYRREAQQVFERAQTQTCPHTTVALAE